LYAMQDEAKENQEACSSIDMSQLSFAATPPLHNTRNCLSPRTPPNTPQTSSSQSLASIPSDNSSSLANQDFVQLSPSNGAMTQHVKAFDPNILQSFKSEAEKIIASLKGYHYNSADITEAYQTELTKIRKLKNATIKKLPTHCHIEFNTEMGIYSRKIIGLRNTALEKKRQQRANRHFSVGK